MNHSCRFNTAVFLASAVILLSPPSGLGGAELEEGFDSLFDGRTLGGWEGDPNLWSVKDGAIVGSSDGHSVDTNTYLIYQKSFADFILRLEVRLRNGNSGIQFRSQKMPGPGWVVHGYQADLSYADDRSAWGNFYEAVSYTHLRAHETDSYLVCRLLLEKKKLGRSD